MNQQITFDGIDQDGSLACPRINVWNDYDLRMLEGVAETVNHGDKGELIVRHGNKCKVRTASGKTGYATFYFIKELKGEWLKQGASLNLWDVVTDA